MTTATKKSRTPKRTPKPHGDKKIRGSLPPSAEIVNLSGRPYLIIPMDEFHEWDDDRMLAALMAERLETDEEIIPFEEVERRLDAKKKRRS